MRHQSSKPCEGGRERKGSLPQNKMCRLLLLLLLPNYLLINPSWQLHLTLTFLAAAICCSFQTVDAVCLLNELIFFFLSFLKTDLCSQIHLIEISSMGQT